MPSRSIVRSRQVERDAAPRPTVQADAGRVVVDVLNEALEVLLLLDDAALEAALEEVADAVVAAVEPDRVEAVQPLHAGRQLRLCRVDEDVEVVVEQAPGDDVPAVLPRHAVEELEPRLAIEVVEDDAPLLDAARDHVIPGGCRQLAARDSRHSATVPRRRDGRNPSKRPWRTCPRDSPWDTSFAAVGAD
jgi:hypothetical protein